MDNLNIQPTAKTPNIAVEFHENELTIQIKGRSIPEDSLGFYQPVFDLLDTYKNAPKPATRIDFQMEYFNTSSSKVFVNLLKRVEAIEGTDKKVNWYYEKFDYDIREAGEDYNDIIEIPFNIIQI